MPKQLMMLTYTFQVVKEMPDIDEDTEGYLEDRGKFNEQLERNLVQSCRDNGALLLNLDSTNEDFYE